VEALERAADSSGRVPFIVASLGHAYALSGRVDESRATIAELSGPSQQRYVSEFNLSVIHAGLGDLDSAFLALEKAFEVRDGRIPYLATEPRFAPLREDPRYQALVRRLGLPG
jgi:hypothetical protein